MNIVKRAASPTPGFFRKLRNIGLALTAVGAAVLGAPVAFPAVVVAIAGYVATAGAVASAVSQVVVKDGEK